MNITSFYAKPEKLISINLGSGNERFDDCIKHNIVSYAANEKAYAMFLQGQTEQIFEHYKSLGFTPEKTKDFLRYMNFFIPADPHILWLCSKNNKVYWGQSDASPVIQGKVDEKRILLTKKLNTGWSGTSFNGQELGLEFMGPKAKDWIKFHKTMMPVKTGKDFFLSVIQGIDKDLWVKNSTEVNANKNKTKSVCVTESEEAWRRAKKKMIKSMRNTADNSNGQIKENIIKDKKNLHSDKEWNEILDKKLKEQKGLCKITKLKLYDGDKWLQPSPDRIDSDGHYHKDNVQIVSWAANYAKGAITPKDVEEFFAALQIKKEV